MAAKPAVAGLINNAEHLIERHTRGPKRLSLPSRWMPAPQIWKRINATLQAGNKYVALLRNCYSSFILVRFSMIILLFSIELNSGS
jgi:hypothetical protein